MGRVHNNKIKYNNGISFKGQAPSDDRLVWESYTDVFVDGENPRDAQMFNSAYKGMSIITFDSEGKTLNLICKDATPYTPGYNITVNEDNYQEYWTNTTEEITLATFFQGGEASDTMATLVKHGCLDAGVTIADLESMTISDIIKAILFETVIPVQTVNISASVAFKSNYAAVQEVGAAMPTVDDLNVTLVSEKWVSTASNGETVGTFLLNKINNGSTIKQYKETAGSDGIDMTSIAYEEIANRYVQPGQRYISASVAYDAYQNAVDTAGRLVKEAYGGTINTSSISFYGRYKIFTNAYGAYTSLNDGWNASKVETTKASANWSQDSVLKTNAPLLHTSIVTMYYKWPSATSASDVFKIFVPTGHIIKTIKAADNFTAKYNINWTATKQSGTVQIEATNGHATGTYDVWTVKKSDGGTTNVEVTIQ